MSVFGLGDLAFLGAASGPQLWTPAQITTALWLDAADSGTVTQSGGLISQVNDKSGNSRSFTANSGSQPIYTTNGLNGLPVFSFSGTQWLTSSSAASTWNFLHTTTGATILAVVKPGSSSDPNAVYGLLGNNSGTAANAGFFVLFDDRASLSRNNALFSSVSSGTVGQAPSSNIGNNALTPNQFSIIANRLDNSNATASARNVATVNAGANIANNTNIFPSTEGNATIAMQIGAVGSGVFPAVAEIEELVIITGLASFATIERSEGYLAHKWGLAANLPSNHPFKSVAPTI